jgi:hypothetical protein
MVSLGFGARFNDGPVGPFPGGALVSGELIETPVDDWSFVAAVETVELQLNADDRRSRTVWILHLDGVAYIPVSLGFPPRKAWHRLAKREGAGVVRVNGKRYPVTLIQIEAPALLLGLAEVNSAKYPPAPGSDIGTWYFRLESRRSI